MDEDDNNYYIEDDNYNEDDNYDDGCNDDGTGYEGASGDKI